MRYLILIISIGLLPISLSSCIEKTAKRLVPGPIYKVEGHLINGTTGEPYKKTSISLIHHPNILFFMPEREVLRTTMTDETGWFSFIYDEINNSRAELFIEGQDINEYPSVRVNEYVSRTFYSSSMGSVHLSLKPIKPWSAGDTLFISYAEESDTMIVQHTDTILTPLRGYYKKVRASYRGVRFFWWRNRSIYSQGENWMTVDVDGDPIVNKATINY